MRMAEDMIENYASDYMNQIPPPNIKHPRVCAPAMPNHRLYKSNSVAMQREGVLN